MTSDEFLLALVNHLWQSTVVAGIASLLCVAFRKNDARVRYGVWFAASVKFLLPFSLLMTAGEWLRSLIPDAIVAQPLVANSMEKIAQPFQPAQFFDAAAPAAAAAAHTNLRLVLFAAWAWGALIVLARFGRGWWKVHRAKCAAQVIGFTRPGELLGPDSPTGAKAGSFPGEASVSPAAHTLRPRTVGLPVLATPELLEPGIVGIFRPVLLIPEGILERLNAEQLRAILVHEMAHVRRRDNLTFAIHMIVEALFWFYPPVWWIGRQLIDERERACDEAVVESGKGAQIYAEGILNVCKFYVESPVACVAGVTGADLKKRIARIMAENAASRLSPSRKILLGTAALLAMAAPLTVGLMHAAEGGAQISAEESSAKPIHFEVASIRQNTSNSGRMTFNALDDGVAITGAPVELLIEQAFGVQRERILGLPAWARTDCYDIQAKVDDADVTRWKTLTLTRSKVAFQALLASRFNFKAHSEMRQQQVYSLVVAKSGPRFHEAKPGDTYPNGLKKDDGTPLGQGMIIMPGVITIQAGRMASLVRMLSMRGLGYPIEDRTGLTGVYDMTVVWTQLEPGASDDPNAPLFAALQDQLGLKLELEKQPMEMIVVDRIEKPTPN